MGKRKREVKSYREKEGGETRRLEKRERKEM